MPYRAQIDDHGQVTRYKDTDTGEIITAKEFERRTMMQSGTMSYPMPSSPQLYATAPGAGYNTVAPGALQAAGQSNGLLPPPPAYPSGGLQQPGYGQMPAAAPGQMPAAMPGQMPAPMGPAPAPTMSSLNNSSLIQPGAQMLNGTQGGAAPGPLPSAPGAMPAGSGVPGTPASPGAGAPPTAGQEMQSKNMRLEGVPGHTGNSSKGYRTHGFLDATSIAILLPTLVLLALIIAAAHKKRLFPWQTIRTFNPPSGLMTPRDYERSYVCPPNLRRHGRLGKRNPQATWTDQDGIVIPFGFLARTHLPITIPLGRLPNKNMFIVAPSGSGKTTLMRAVIKALMAKPCVIIALEAKANDPSLDEKRESFKHTVLPEAQTAGFDCLYFNPLDPESIHWNPLDLDPITFASSIVQDVNSLPPEEQHWAERDHGYINGLTQLLKWGAVMVAGEDENGQAAEVQPLPCNPRGLMRLVNNRRNIVESLRRLKNNPDVPVGELNELTQTLSSIIRTDSDWDKNIQGVRGRLRMFKNPGVLRCTESSNIDIRAAMHKATVLIFGAPASMGPDAESLASCFVYQLQNALHTRYGTASVLPLFAFFDEYQTLNMDIAGRLSAIVRGANGGLTIILQNISQIAQIDGTGGGTGVSPELKTIFSNSAIRVCLHNADESTAKFFSDEIGKHAIIVPGISDHYDANGFGIFPTSWNRIHSQQVVPRVDADGIKRMEKHHALVYLSPAGDPEFGETKPFMCDLRGIEEIARLHLLHNVAGRNGGPAGLPSPEGPDAGQLPPGVTPGTPGQVPGGAKIGSPVLASMMSPQALEKAAQFLNAPQAPVAHSNAGAPAVQPVVETSVTGALVGAAAGVAANAAIGAAANAMARPPFPGSTPPPAASLPPGVAAPNPVLAATGGPVTTPIAPTPAQVAAQAAMQAAAAPMAMGAMQAMGAPMAPQAAPQAPMAPAAAMMPQAPMPPQAAMAPQAPVGAAPAPPAGNAPSGQDRTCTKCGKWPGKGRFCIECGSFVGQPGAAGNGPITGAPAAPMPAAAQPAMPAQGAPAFPGQPQAPVAQQRPPVTSLNVDMSKYGLGKQPTAPAEQPGQQPMPRPQQRGNGIEF